MPPFPRHDSHASPRPPTARTGHGIRLRAPGAPGAPPLPLRYLRASPLPHATALASAGVCLTLALAALSHLDDGSHRAAAACAALAAGWLGLACVALLDGFSRFREYRRIKAMLARHGWNRRVFTLVAGSRCQRDAALQAAHEAGHGRRARRFFRALGYRWYHLLPDAVARNPLCFFHPRFLRGSFLPGKAPRARSRQRTRQGPAPERTRGPQRRGGGGFSPEGASGP